MCAGNFRVFFFFLKSSINIFIEKNKLFKAIYFSLLDFLKLYF